MELDWHGGRFPKGKSGLEEHEEVLLVHPVTHTLCMSSTFFYKASSCPTSVGPFRCLVAAPVDGSLVGRARESQPSGDVFIP